MTRKGVYTAEQIAAIAPRATRIVRLYADGCRAIEHVQPGTRNIGGRVYHTCLYAQEWYDAQGHPIKAPLEHDHGAGPGLAVCEWEEQPSPGISVATLPDGRFEIRLHGFRFVLSSAEARELHHGLGAELDCRDDCPCWEAGHLCAQETVGDWYRPW
jgi:hypothetical protein